MKDSHYPHLDNLEDVWKKEPIFTFVTDLAYVTQRSLIYCSDTPLCLCAVKKSLRIILYRILHIHQADPIGSESRGKFGSEATTT